ncbi:hypothetical protein ACTI_26400 [Actinoplanes sp. OR16]|uniref:hypothetical protein n=1 Tax=Actinoplanes sp. OR16 TaxID=946334 RepID=UPI000F6F45CC|nr:hypothetical protein [Actinoplanes sp. OR16]BBH65955.1 hypothetical protein ACTI_26400 [Actinoplanes sp. OR16]
MTDQLQELLADLRESAVREIRPPGAAAARRTVRRRRTTGVVAVACALTAALLGGFTLVKKPTAAPALPAATPAVPSASSPVLGLNPAQRLAAVAFREIHDDRPAFEQTGPVREGGIEQRMYLPKLALTAACAGEGRFTLVVTADVAGDLHDRHQDKELARIKVRCSDDPAPVTRELDAFLLPVLRFGIEDASGDAGYAFRVTGQGDAPLAPHDEAASVEKMLDMTTSTRKGAW